MFEAFGATARRARTRQEAIASTVLALRDAWGPPPLGRLRRDPDRRPGRGVDGGHPAHPPTAGTGRRPARDRPTSPSSSGCRRASCCGSAAGSWPPDAEERRRPGPRLGAPVLTSYAGRGLLAGHPLLVDAPVHEPEVGAVLAEADLLLVLGSSFDGMNTKNWRLDLPARRAAVTLGAMIGRRSSSTASSARTWPRARRARGGTATTWASPRDPPGSTSQRSASQSSSGCSPIAHRRRDRPGCSRSTPAGPPTGRSCATWPSAGYWVGRLQLSAADPAAAVPGRLGHPRLCAAGVDRPGLGGHRHAGRLRRRRADVRTRRAGHLRAGVAAGHTAGRGRRRLRDAALRPAGVRASGARRRPAHAGVARPGRGLRDRRPRPSTRSTGSAGRCSGRTRRTCAASRASSCGRSGCSRRGRPPALVRG